MPKETFADQFSNESGNTLQVKWGSFGTVELGVENPQDLEHFVNQLVVAHENGEEDADPSQYHGFWLSLSRDELKRLIKVLTRAARQYDSRTESVDAPEVVEEPPVVADPAGEIKEEVEP